MFTFTLKTDNAAFEDDLAWSEIARLLRETADRVEQQKCDSGVLRDSNGNRVGVFDYQPLA